MEAGGFRFGEGFFKDFVFCDGAFCDGFVDAGEVLVDDAAGAEV